MIGVKNKKARPLGTGLGDFCARSDRLGDPRHAQAIATRPGAVMCMRMMVPSAVHVWRRRYQPLGCPSMVERIYGVAP